MTDFSQLIGNATGTTILAIVVFSLHFIDIPVLFVQRLLFF